MRKVTALTKLHIRNLHITRELAYKVTAVLSYLKELDLSDNNLQTAGC